MEPDRWLGIELRHLAALQAIAKERSFHAAAARLSYSQSAVSQQIATLERVVGGKLIERPGGPRTVYLTDLGRLVLRHAEAIVAGVQAAQADAEAMVAGGLGTLRIGTYQSVSERILPALVPRFRVVRPGVEISVIESESDDELLAHVERGELDLAFGLLPLPEGPFAFVELMRDPWMLLVPADSQLAGGHRSVPLHKMASMPLVGARLHRCRMQVDTHFGERGLEPRYVFHSDENGTVHGLVAAGVGMGIVPRLAIDPHDERVVALELEPEIPPRVIALAWHRDRHRSGAAKDLVELASELCAELQRRASECAPHDRTIWPVADSAGSVWERPLRDLACDPRCAVAASTALD